MAFIGQPTTGFELPLEIRSDVFSANGTANSFTLSYAVNYPRDIEVLVNNVQKSPFDGSYSVTGTTLQFASAPTAGSNNVYVIYRRYFQISPTQQIQTVITEYVADQAITAPKLGNRAVTSLKLDYNLSMANVTITGVGVSQNNFSINTRAASANHATQKQYVDALTVVFGA